MATPPPADRFRLGDIWRSPRGKDWKVERISPFRGAFLRACHNRFTTQWRNEYATGRDMMNAWERIHSGSEELRPVQSTSEGGKRNASPD